MKISIENMEEKSSKFQGSEITLLMKIINKYKDIVENKKTDGTMWNQKQVK